MDTTSILICKNHQAMHTLISTNHVEKVNKITLIPTITIITQKMVSIEEVNSKVTLKIAMGTHKGEELTYLTLVTNKQLLILILSIQTRLTKVLWEIL